MKTGKMMRMKMRNGKTNNPLTFQDLFNIQKANQSKMLQDGMYDAFKSESTTTIPVDDVKLMSYHIQQLMSEIGEVLDADKRWKNFRNQKYDENAKLEEIADCFIVLMNIAMFSGFNGVELTNAIINKLNEVSERIGA
jgi:NTP pyrophosphatase (non-canonical NTP hydrolase)